jgi:hypothetical protein
MSVVARVWLAACMVFTGGLFVSALMVMNGELLIHVLVCDGWLVLCIIAMLMNGG